IVEIMRQYSLDELDLCIIHRYCNSTTKPALLLRHSQSSKPPISQVLILTLSQPPNTAIVIGWVGDVSVLCQPSVARSYNYDTLDAVTSPWSRVTDSIVKLILLRKNNGDATTGRGRRRSGGGPEGGRRLSGKWLDTSTRVDEMASRWFAALLIIIAPAVVQGPAK
ncbi:hypothetical protein LSAT2_005077, partial [Lamellibrachia satsuma]